MIAKDFSAIGGSEPRVTAQSEGKSGQCPNCGSLLDWHKYQYTPTLDTKVTGISVIWGCTACGCEWEEYYPIPERVTQGVITQGRKLNA